MAAHFRALHSSSTQCARTLNVYLAETNLNFHTSSQIKLHKCINSFFSRLNNIQQTLMCTDLVLITRVFINVRGNQYSEALFTSRQRNRTAHWSTCTLCCFNNLLSRGVDKLVIKSLQANSDALILHVNQTPVVCIKNFQYAGDKNTPSERRRNSKGDL